MFGLAKYYIIKAHIRCEVLFHMNLMLLTILRTKAAYCYHQGESFADLKEDNE